MSITSDHIIHATYIFYSFLFWTLIYIMVVLCSQNINIPPRIENKKKELDVLNRIVSFMHGLVLLSMSTYKYYFVPIECGEINSFFDECMIYCAVGYFSYDFVAMAFYGLLDM